MKALLLSKNFRMFIFLTILWGFRRHQCRQEKQYDSHLFFRALSLTTPSNRLWKYRHLFIAHSLSKSPAHHLRSLLPPICKTSPYPISWAFSGNFSRWSRQIRRKAAETPIVKAKKGSPTLSFGQVNSISLRRNSKQATSVHAKYEPCLIGDDRCETYLEIK